MPASPPADRAAGAISGPNFRGFAGAWQAPSHLWHSCPSPRGRPVRQGCRDPECTTGGNAMPAQSTSNRRLRWGIISTADIGLKKVIPGIQRSPHSEVVAIASRDLKRAQHAAERLGIPNAYGTYEEMLADPAVEAVYNPLPNHLHVPLTLQATRAGKHVLCEKPIAITAAEAEQMCHCPRDRIVMEAFMVRSHPRCLCAREIVKSGEIGELKTVNVVFSYFNADPNNVRNQADIG